VLLRGVGESSDATSHVIAASAGPGRQLAMRSALAGRGLATSQIDSVTLARHGHAEQPMPPRTAPMCAVLGTSVPCSSTKGHTGHTLGARLAGLESRDLPRWPCATRPPMPGGCHTDGAPILSCTPPIWRANRQRRR